MRLKGKVEKGWGSEEIFVTNDKYCGKFMHFNQDSKFSMHFHAEKQETWYVMSGLYELHHIDTETAEKNIKILGKGDTWTNMPLVPHQIHCLKPGTILEVSTPDSVEDNYRVLPGDSQK